MKTLFNKMCFFKAHPLVNEQLLDYASSIAILSRRDFSNDIINPIETDSEILDSSNVILYERFLNDADTYYETGNQKS